MSRYTCPVTVASMKKNGPMTEFLVNPHQTFTLGVSLSCTWITWRFSEPHIWQLCLLILLHKWKVASSEKTMLSRYKLSFSIYRSISAGKCVLSGWSLGFMWRRSWILKAHKYRRLWMILWILCLGIWSSVLALRIDFHGLLANAILTNLVVSSFTDTFACLPVCDSKDPVCRSVLSHLRIALWPGGCTFHVRRTWHCTQVTDFCSASHNTHWTFCSDVHMFTTARSISYWMATAFSRNKSYCRACSCLKTVSHNLGVSLSCHVKITAISLSVLNCEHLFLDPSSVDTVYM